MPGGFGPGPERFGTDTWVTRDMCDPEPWPFADDVFDFAICTFTLEDIRDPVRVCAEMSRVARAGYIEVPSLLDELSHRNPEARAAPGSATRTTAGCACARTTRWSSCRRPTPCTPATASGCPGAGPGG